MHKKEKFSTQSIHRNPRETLKCCYCSFSPPSLPTTLPFQLPIEMERRTAGTSGWQSELESLLIESKLPTVFLPAASSKLLRVPLGMLQGCQVGWQLSLCQEDEEIKSSPAQVPLVQIDLTGMSNIPINSTVPKLSNTATVAWRQINHEHTLWVNREAGLSNLCVL